jgi:hypothetical protein
MALVENVRKFRRLEGLLIKLFLLGGQTGRKVRIYFAAGTARELSDV